MPRLLDPSRAAWLYPLRVCYFGVSNASALTSIGYLLFCVESVPMASLQGPPSPHRPPLILHILHPLLFHLPAPGRLPCHLPGQLGMGERCIPGAW